MSTWGFGMVGLHKARIATAGAYLNIDGVYPFGIGAQLHKGRIPVKRKSHMSQTSHMSRVAREPAHQCRIWE